MGKSPAYLAFSLLLSLASPCGAAVFEDWSVLDATHTQAVKDDSGSEALFISTEGPKAGERALKVESLVKGEGACGVKRVLSADLSRAGALRFMAKSTQPGWLQVSLQDDGGTQVSAHVQVPSKEWTEVTLDMSWFRKDPPDAAQSADLSRVKAVLFYPRMKGEAVLWVGPLGTGQASKKTAFSPFPFVKTDAPAAKAAKVVIKGGGMMESWTAIDSSNTGPYSDSNGTKVAFSIVAGPQGGEKALKVKADRVTGGYAGVWHNMAADLSHAASLKFQAKSDVAQDVQLAIVDANSVQYIVRFAVDKEWAEVTVPLSSFRKDTTYTPPGAVLGKPLDVSEVKGMNFGPQTAGPSELLVGPVLWMEGKFESAAGPGTSIPKGKGVTAVLQEFAVVSGGLCGSFTDPKGSKLEFTYQDADKRKNPDDKVLSIHYKLLSGGYCGLWYRSGDNWDGVDLSDAVGLLVVTYTSKPLVIGLALKDKNNNQYIAECPPTAGGRWETVAVPLSAFIRDPGYTPPDAIKGAPKDFSNVKTFNISPKTEGVYDLAIDKILIAK